jgi:hypothetical protein
MESWHISTFQSAANLSAQTGVDEIHADSQVGRVHLLQQVVLRVGLDLPVVQVGRLVIRPDVRLRVDDQHGVHSAVTGLISRSRGSTSFENSRMPFSDSAWVMKPERPTRLRCPNPPTLSWKSMICR